MNSPNKPTAYESPNSYDYNRITDREFEELLYSIFELRIQHESEFRKNFTNVWLPTGVGERGQDVILTNDEIHVGLIQCKRINSNLSKPTCAQEIIKFGIHAILDKTLISPPGAPFTYFLAVSKGFANTAIDLLSSFTSKILTEVDFKNWVNKVLNDYEEFRSKQLQYDDISCSLSEILTRLQVRLIIPSQLDLWLSTYPAIVSRFFRVKIVETGIQHSLPQTTNRSNMTTELISERFVVASSTLRNYPASFANLNGYHIDRNETSDLLTWIKQPLRSINKTKSLKPEYSQPIAVLSGDAGYGKTVVMHDLLLRLAEEDIPTLGIKADQASYSKRQQLTDELRLGDDIENQVATLAQIHERVVIIIDQLDALSQHLSANREPLKMYSRLIDQLANISNIRIVIACRRFDLRYDPSLIQYQDKFVVPLKPLDRADVEKVFVQLQLVANSLTQPLFELLCVPLHLNIFTKVYKHVNDYTQLNSVQDLYHELWKQKIVNSPSRADTIDSRRVLELTRLIAMAMYGQQEIQVPFRHYENEFSTELSYLSSEGIIRIEETKIQFLHQSFFDYVYARTFVDGNKDLAEEIAGSSEHPKHQGLFVRSKVRQILLYLREVDPKMYQQQVKKILTSSTFRFHIKLLVLQSLAFQNDPTPTEQRLVETVIFSESLLRDAFLESISSPVWLKFLNYKQLIQGLFTENYSLGKGLLYPLCNRISPIDQISVVDFLMNLPEFPQRYDFVALVLLGVKEFEDPRSLKLFEEVAVNQPLSDFHFYHIIENAVKHFPDWVSQRIWLRLLPELETIERKPNSEEYLPADRYEFISTMDKLHIAFPEIAIELSLQILTSIIERTRLEHRSKVTHDLYSDLAFILYTPGRSHSRYTHHELDSKLRQWLVDLEPNNHTFISHKVELLLDQKATTLLSVGLHIIHAYSDIYASQFFSRLTTDNFITHFNEIGNDYFRFSVREALRLCFPHFKTEQKELLMHLILTVKPSGEGRVHRYQFFGEQVDRHPVGLAQYKLFLVLPDDFINADSILKIQKQELKRRFERVEHERPEGMRLMPASVLPNDAYDNMNDSQWVSSFIKYDERKGRNWDGVDELSHSQRFSEEVKKNPGRFINLIKRIINEKDVPNVYVNEGLDGLEKGEYNPEIVKQLLLQAISRTNEAHYQLRLIWLTRYLLNNDIFEEDIFNFLQYTALTGSQEDTNDGKAVERGINQTRGAATGILIKYAERKNYTERVFDTLEKSINSASVSTRAAILYYHVFLNGIDKHRNLNLFVQICNGFETELARVAIHALQYHININFEPLIPFFEKAINADDAIESLTQILTNAYVFGYMGSERLLYSYLTVSAKTVASSVNNALDFIATSNSSYQQKGLAIVNCFLDDDRSEIIQAYRHGFDDLTIQHFPIVREFLFSYVQSKVGRQRDGDFYKYLLKCVQDYANDCLKLVEFFENHEGPDITQRALEQEPFEVVIQAYNTYKKYDEPDENLERAMDLFDKMLQITAYRREARKATDDI